MQRLIIALLVIGLLVAGGTALNAQSTTVLDDPRLEPLNMFEQAVDSYWSRDYETALEGFDRTLTQDPRRVDAYVYRSAVYRILGEEELAERDLAAALSLDPNSALAHSMRARLHLAQDNQQQALMDANLAIRLDPELAIAYYNRGQVHIASDNFAAALQDFDQAIALQG
ncbi:MAG: tetratricopeptide repeat protein, partial [Phototrophicaceae bacterium]